MQNTTVLFYPSNSPNHVALKRTRTGSRIKLALYNSIWHANHAQNLLGLSREALWIVVRPNPMSIENTPVEPLLQALKDPDEEVRQQATDDLWRLWFEQKGIYGTRLLMKSQALLEAGKVQDAEELLDELVIHQPDFAEAWNRRAVLHFTQNRYQKAIIDCEKTLELVPYHFGALHGLGLCHASIGNYVEAIAAFRRALEVQPYATLNQRLLLECTARLS